MSYPITEVTEIKFVIVAGLRDQEDWLNASWLKTLTDCPKGCPKFLQALDELQQVGVIESYTPSLQYGDIRRIDDDFRLTMRA